MHTFFFPPATFLTPDYAEVSYYLGYRKPAAPEENVMSLIKECCKEMQAVLKPKACYETYDLQLCAGAGLQTDAAGLNASAGLQTDEPVSNSAAGLQTNAITFADVTLTSQDLARNLSGCKKITLVAATIGAQVDSLIRKYEKTDSAKAGILQAAGAMYIEKLVDLVNEEIKKSAALQGLKCKPRYSPGYGDVSLEVQKDFFRLLPCSKLGLSLMDTLIMAPEKSVTAFIGSF